MSGRYIPRIPPVFLHLSGGPVTGSTLFTENLSAGTYFSGSTPLEDIIFGVANFVSGSYLPLSGGTGGPYDFTGTTSASTVLVSNSVEPTVDNVVDLGTPLRRFRNLRTVNGVAVEFTASTKIQLGSVELTEYSVVLTGDTVNGGIW